MSQIPTLWSFRRCPYAIRARLAIASAGVKVELREILLKDKPDAFLQTSVSGTVPALQMECGNLDESLDIMIWALNQSDPHNLLTMPQDGWDLITTNDGPFKTALDHTKYAIRYPEFDKAVERKKAADHLFVLDEILAGQTWLFGDRPTIADIAILPFVRQFAHIDKGWFDAQPWPYLITWLDRFLTSDQFSQVMTKYAAWSEGDPTVWFGQAEHQA